MIISPKKKEKKLKTHKLEIAVKLSPKRQ